VIKEFKEGDIIQLQYSVETTLFNVRVEENFNIEKLQRVCHICEDKYFSTNRSWDETFIRLIKNCNVGVSIVKAVPMSVLDLAIGYRKIKEYQVQFKELQTVTLENLEIDFSPEVTLENVVAHTTGIVHANSIHEVRKLFKNNKLNWEWSEPDEYPNGEPVLDVIDTYNREIVNITLLKPEIIVDAELPY
jgi:hypothetical protein